MQCTRTYSRQLTLRHVRFGLRNLYLNITFTCMHPIFAPATASLPSATCASACIPHT